MIGLIPTHLLPKIKVNVVVGSIRIGVNMIVAIKRIINEVFLKKILVSMLLSLNDASRSVITG